MINRERIPRELLKQLESRLEGKVQDIVFPPPVFDALQGEIIDYDLEEKMVQTRFPILAAHLNPYGNMQGGIISAAIDNTIGPLSMLVSPPNFTRYMKVKYGKVVSPDLGFIYVTAHHTGGKKRFLYFEAVVRDSDGNILASAESTHWVI
ncbi:MAG: PaaI family thioesterase [Thermodesulfobacteriota bacterium]